MKFINVVGDQLLELERTSTMYRYRYIENIEVFEHRCWIFN